MSDTHDPTLCNCPVPLHNLLVCCGPVCAPPCPHYEWALRHGLVEASNA